MAHYTAADLDNQGPLPDTAEYIVIGAGMAGLYTAWNILKENCAADVFIFEKEGRTGGRLDSDLVYFKNHYVVKEEEGGMRFTENAMPELKKIICEMKLTEQVVQFPMNSHGNNQLYFKCLHSTEAEAGKKPYDYWKKIYKLDGCERGKNPKTIINEAFQRILLANPDIFPPDSPELWQTFRLEAVWGGQTLNNWQLSKLLTAMGYSDDCITLLSGLSGFNGPFDSHSEMNAGVAFQLLEDFPAHPQFKTLRDGFSALPNALVDRITCDRIFLNTTLESIAKRGEQYQLTCTRNRETMIVHAKKVILALPRLALENLFDASSALKGSPCFKTLLENLNKTTSYPLLKINLYYDNAWWGSPEPPVEYGPNLSDLPLGSVYPFYAIDTNPDDIDYSKPAALTIYCDCNHINFWNELQNCGRLFDSYMQQRYRDTMHAASQAVVERATEFFRDLFQDFTVRDPVLTSIRIWDGGTVIEGDTPSVHLGYGIHQWALGADDCQVIPYMTQPVPNLYICGEAYSDYQGWVEGALRSANLVLDALGMPDEALGTLDVNISDIFYEGQVPVVESDEYVEVANNGGTAADLSGWLINAGGNKQNFKFPAGTVLKARQSYRVYTNEIHPETGGFSFGSVRAIWNNQGDEGQLFDSEGQLVSSYKY